MPTYRSSRIVLLLVVCSVFGHYCRAAQPKGDVPGQPLTLTPEGQRRFVERQQRLAVAKGYAEAHRKAFGSYLSSLNTVGNWLVGLKAKDEAVKVAAEIEAVDPAYGNLASLKKSIDGIAKSEYFEDAHTKDLTARLKSAKKLKADGLLGLARTCFEANLLGYAYDLVGEMLDADPDHQIAHTARGEVKLPDGWHTPFAAAQITSGKTYVFGKGWVITANAERVGKGEWFEDNKWMTTAEADKLHSDPAKPWIVETDNFILRSTDTRKQTIVVAERLEGIRRLCFRQFLEYFMRGSAKKGAQLLFNQSAPKKMLVYFFGTQEDYAAFIMKEMKGGDVGLLLNSAGFYSPTMHNCYFFHGEQPTEFMIPLMQHEVTHQVLGEFTKGGNPPTWMAEGIASVLEYAKYDAQRKLMLPSGADHEAVLHACELLEQNALPPAGTIFGLSHAGFHSGANRHRNYHVSGALCRFLLEMQNGAYAADFLECLCDNYRGLRTANLNDYLAMDNTEIDKQFRAYLKVELAKIPATKKQMLLQQ